MKRILHGSAFECIDFIIIKIVFSLFSQRTMEYVCLHWDASRSVVSASLATRDLLINLSFGNLFKSINDDYDFFFFAAVKFVLNENDPMSLGHI